MTELFAVLESRFPAGQVLEFKPTALHNSQCACPDTVGCDPHVALMDEGCLVDLPLIEKCDCVSRATTVAKSRKLVIVGSSASAPEIIALLNAGADGYLPKSFDDDMAELVLRFVMTGRKFIPDSILDPYSQGQSEEGEQTRSTRAAPMEKLTQRERNVVERMAMGATNKEIARSLCIQEITVKSHMKSIFRKFGVRNRTEAARIVTGLASGVTQRSV